MRRAAKIDANQPSIIKAFRSLGWSVLVLSQMGQGCPDILCAKAGLTILAEIKDGSLPASQRKLTPDQRDFHRKWLGCILIIKSIDDVSDFDRKRFKSLPELLGNVIN